MILPNESDSVIQLQAASIIPISNCFTQRFLFRVLQYLLTQQRACYSCLSPACDKCQFVIINCMNT